jgi:hypothetical protein
MDVPIVVKRVHRMTYSTVEQLHALMMKWRTASSAASYAKRYVEANALLRCANELESMLRNEVEVTREESQSQSQIQSQ